MKGNAEGSKDIKHERTNSSGKAVGTGELRWQRKCGNVTSPFVILSVTVFGFSRGEEQEPLQLAGRPQFWKINQHSYFQVYQYDREPIGSLKWHCWKVRRHEIRHFSGVLARDIRGL